MATVDNHPREIDIAAVRGAVAHRLNMFLAEKENGLHGEFLARSLDVLRRFLVGGKRLRPLYCIAGWHAAGGGEDQQRLLDVAIGLELFHAFALLHDDVIDRSELRHQRPTAHLEFARNSPVEDRDWYGNSAAVLLGDLCEVWSAELLACLAEHDIPSPARATLDQMRTELVTGQILDITPGAGFGTQEEAFRVIRYKTTRYTVERPLQIGVAMAGGDSELLAACAAYAEPLGEAFQLFDDLEDVLPGATDAAGNDLRRGKHTVVLAMAAERAVPSQLVRLRQLVGREDLRPQEVAEARELIAATGATAAVRHMIVERRSRALEVLAQAPFQARGLQALQTLTDLALPGVERWAVNVVQ